MKRVMKHNDEDTIRYEHGADLSLTDRDAHTASDRLFMSTSGGWLKTRRAWLIIILLLSSELIFHVVRTAIMINAHYNLGCSLELMSWKNSDWYVLLIHGILELLFTCGALAFFHSGKVHEAHAFAILLFIFSMGRFLNFYDSNKVFFWPFADQFIWLLLLNYLLQIGQYSLLVLLLVLINKKKADAVISVIAMVFTIFNLIIAFGYLGMDVGRLRLVNLTARLLYLMAMLLVFKCDRLLAKWCKRVQR